jgi:hypothetical protein
MRQGRTTPVTNTDHDPPHHSISIFVDQVRVLGDLAPANLRAEPDIRRRRFASPSKAERPEWWRHLMQLSIISGDVSQTTAADLLIRNRARPLAGIGEKLAGRGISVRL